MKKTIKPGQLWSYHGPRLELRGHGATIVSAKEKGEVKIRWPNGSVESLDAPIFLHDFLLVRDSPGSDSASVVNPAIKVGQIWRYNDEGEVKTVTIIGFDKDGDPCIRWDNGFNDGWGPASFRKYFTLQAEAPAAVEWSREEAQRLLDDANAAVERYNAHLDSQPRPFRKVSVVDALTFSGGK